MPLEVVLDTFRGPKKDVKSGSVLLCFLLFFRDALARMLTEAYCDHVETEGQRLFQLGCQHDLEGIVAKSKSDPYLSDHATWLKIRNPNYSQWVGREELFERERSSNPACDTYAQKTQPYSSILRELYQKNSQNHSRLNTVTIARKCVRQSSLAIGLTLGMLNT